jgi:hypothetical protein
VVIVGDFVLQKLRNIFFFIFCVHYMLISVIAFMLLKWNRWLL